MVLVTFKNDKGEEVQHYIDGYLKENLDIVKDSVINKGWDYVAVVSGIPGVGKSTLAQTICKYLDDTFTTKDRICFTGLGEKGLLERTANAKLGQAFMLDESFESMNSKVSRSNEFVRIMNHLQLIRQKGLFIILCIPNFFDLSKGFAIFRSSHLFVVYHDKFKRGFFGAFDRDAKRQLFVKGNKYIDYNCVQPNFRATFTKEWIADLELYEKLKLEHLKEQSLTKNLEPMLLDKKIRNNFILGLHKEGRRAEDIAEMGGLTSRTIYNVINEEKNEKNTALSKN